MEGVMLFRDRRKIKGRKRMDWDFNN